MRIASLQPSISITLKALGRLDAICACTKYCVEALPELAGLGIPVLHDSWSAGASEIKAAQPDLVIASVPYRLESLAAILKCGLPLLALAPHNLADIYGDIRLIASTVDARREGETLVEEMQIAVGAARARTSSLVDKPLVYCEEWGKPLIQSQFWVAELVEAAGGRFFGETGSHTTPEAVAAADPDVLIFGWCGAGDRVPLAKVVAQRNWGSLRAVQHGRVHCVPDDLLNTPASTLLGGLECLAGLCQPGLFGSDNRVKTLAPVTESVATR